MRPSPISMLLSLAALPLLGCAHRPTAQSTTTTTATTTREKEPVREREAVADAQVSASVDRPPAIERGPMFHTTGGLPKPLPLSATPPPSKGFEILDASVVVTCERAFTFRLEDGALLRSVEQLQAAYDGDAYGPFERACRGDLDAVDFERSALVAVRLGFTGSLTYVATRKDTLEVGVFVAPYCSGPAPPGPILAFVAVPASLRTVEFETRAEGRCTGPPQP